MQATIDVRLANLQQMKADKFERMIAILQGCIEKAFPEAIVRVRPSPSMSDISVFGLGKEGKKNVAEFLEALFDEGSAFDELNDGDY